MLYGEPRNWLPPARQYLATVLLKTMQYKKAEKICRQDLFINPNNLWSLTGLKIAQEKQGNKIDAAITAQRLRKASTRADIRLNNVAF